MQADGINLMAAVKGAELANRPFFWEHLLSRAVYRDGWKLGADKTLWKLYDLSQDPAEQSDLSSKHPERASALKALWTEWAEEYAVIPWPSARKKPSGKATAVPAPSISKKSGGQSAKNSWASLDEWNQEKPGYEWLFVFTDKNRDGQIDPAEYEALQQYKKKHGNAWQDQARNGL